MEDEQIVDPVEPQEPTEPEASEPTEPIEGAEPSTDEPAEPTPVPAKKENRVQARIDEITREKYAAKQEAEYWKKVATGEIKPQPAPQPVHQPTLAIPNLPPEPNQDDFEDWNDYNKALAIWGGKVALAEQTFTTQQKQQQEAQQAVYKTHQDRVTAAKAKYPDFDEVVALAPDIRFNDLSYGAILESDQSADLQYYFSSKPEEAARINALLPVQQIKEIAKLETKFASTAQPVKRATQAPQPINPIGGSGSGVVDPDKMTDEQWIEHERKRLAAMGRRY